MIKKMKRRGPTLDMTAMVDVAFLLLTFFMLTTQFKAPEPIPIVLPSSNAEVKLPPSNILMVTVSEAGQEFIGEEGKEEARPIPLTDLSDVLVQYRVRNPAFRTVIKADRNADYGPHRGRDEGHEGRQHLALLAHHRPRGRRDAARRGRLISLTGGPCGSPTPHPTWPEWISVATLEEDATKRSGRASASASEWT